MSSLSSQDPAIAASSDFILEKVCSALQSLAGAARSWHGLIPSILDRRTAAIPARLPEPILGQRQSDRSYPGFNLMHDHVVLRLMFDLAEAGEAGGFADCADSCLRRFTSHCCQTPSGLFPWGEHSFWNLIEDRAGNGYAIDRSLNEIKHDHLLQAPVWLWEKLWSLDSRVVLRFAEGLDNHWQTGEPPEYNRHASLMTLGRNSCRAKRSCDFPRHGGFYILDWAFAFAKTGDQRFRRQILSMLDYWWARYGDGRCLPIESRSPAGDPYEGMLSPTQTLSLGVSLLEAAQLLDPCDQPLSLTCSERGTAYIRAYLLHPRQPASAPRDEGSMSSDEANRWTNRHNPPVIFGSVYGSAPLSSEGLLLIRASRLLSDNACLDAAISIGREVRQAVFPQDLHVPVKDAGLALSLLVDLHHADASGSWLNTAGSLAPLLTEIYLDAPLPRLASGIDSYESQAIPGQLLHALARYALSVRDGFSPFAADYTIR